MLFCIEFRLVRKQHVEPMKGHITVFERNSILVLYGFSLHRRNTAVYIDLLKKWNLWEKIDQKMKNKKKIQDNRARSNSPVTRNELNKPLTRNGRLNSSPSPYRPHSSPGNKNANAIVYVWSCLYTRCCISGRPSSLSPSGRIKSEDGRRCNTLFTSSL